MFSDTPYYILLLLLVKARKHAVYIKLDVVNLKQTRIKTRTVQSRTTQTIITHSLQKTQTRTRNRIHRPHSPRTIPSARNQPTDRHSPSPASPSHLQGSHRNGPVAQSAIPSHCHCARKCSRLLRINHQKHLWRKDLSRKNRPAKDKPEHAGAQLPQRQPATHLRTFRSMV